MAAAAFDGKESSLFEQKQGQRGSKHTVTTTFRHPSFPTLPSKIHCPDIIGLVLCILGV